MEEWDKIWHLIMPGNYFVPCVHENCWYCCHDYPYMVGIIKVANFQQYVERHFLTFVQSMISDDIGVHNNQSWPDLGFLSWSKIDTFTPKETWFRGQHPSLWSTRTFFIKLWFNFGFGKWFQTISIHAIVKTTWSSKVHLTPTLP